MKTVEQMDFDLYRRRISEKLDHIVREQLAEGWGRAFLSILRFDNRT
jgi:hypothetical protein